MKHIKLYETFDHWKDTTHFAELKNGHGDPVRVYFYSSKEFVGAYKDVDGDGKWHFFNWDRNGFSGEATGHAPMMNIRVPNDFEKNTTYTGIIKSSDFKNDMMAPMINQLNK